MTKTVSILKFILFAFILVTISTSTTFAFKGQGGFFGQKSRVGYGIETAVTNLPAQELSQAEKDALIKMVEEEKLARDVYVFLYSQLNNVIFDRISQSEQRHMDAVSALISKYGLENPVEGLEVGQFVTPSMQDLYENLTSRGAESLEQALQVGATIEDLDIKDLKELIGQCDNQDILMVFQNLEKGSRNHMRAFTSYLKVMGISYNAQYLTQDEVDGIISKGWERGPVDQNGKIMNGFGRGWTMRSCPCLK